MWVGTSRGFMTRSTGRPSASYFFFFNDTATTEIYTLSLHDALPISGDDSERVSRLMPGRANRAVREGRRERREAFLRNNRRANGRTPINLLIRMPAYRCQKKNPHRELLRERIHDPSVVPARLSLGR